MRSPPGDRLMPGKPPLARRGNPTDPVRSTTNRSDPRNYGEGTRCVRILSAAALQGVQATHLLPLGAAALDSESPSTREKPPAWSSAKASMTGQELSVSAPFGRRSQVRSSLDMKGQHPLAATERRMSYLLAALLTALPLTVAAALPSAKAILKDVEGREVATATLAPVKGGVRVTVAAKGLAPGRHGIHIHTVGKCDPPDFATAGGHFNPNGRKHGLQNPAGAHAGDLPNLIVGKEGRARATFIAHGATLGDGAESIFSPDGTALVIHANPDDEKSDPAGNSGPRIACGVIER